MSEPVDFNGRDRIAYRRKVRLCSVKRKRPDAGEVIVVVGQAVDESEIVEFIAVNAGCEQPDECLYSCGMVVNQSPRDVLACTDSSDPIHEGIELNSSSKNGIPA